MRLLFQSRYGLSKSRSKEAHFIWAWEADRYLKFEKRSVGFLHLSSIWPLCPELPARTDHFCRLLPDVFQESISNLAPIRAVCSVKVSKLSQHLQFLLVCQDWL